VADVLSLSRQKILQHRQREGGECQRTYRGTLRQAVAREREFRENQNLVTRVRRGTSTCVLASACVRGKTSEVQIEELIMREQERGILEYPVPVSE
jgi:hypothetical protein